MRVLDAAKVIQFVSDDFHCLDEIRRSTRRRSLYPVDWCPLGALVQSASERDVIAEPPEMS